MRSGSSGSRRGGLATPHGGAGALPAVGGRSRLVARQRVRRGRRRLPRRGVLRRGGAWLGGVGLVLAAVAGGVGWLLSTPRLAIRAVEVEGAVRVPPAQIIAAAGIAPGTNLLRADPGAARARLEAMAEIRRAEVVREFPDRVRILVEERRPFTLVHAGRLHWLDEEARLLWEAREAVHPSVPVISGLSEEDLASLRSAPGPRARAAIALVRALVRSGSPLAAEISEIDMSRREGPVLYTVDGIEVRLGSEQWEERLARLEGVLPQLAAQGGARVTAVDLRFRDQIVLRNGERQ